MKRKEPLDVLRIVADYLVDHGYDGLCNAGPEGCGCECIDLAPCCGNEIPAYCHPAYNHPATAKKNKCGIWMTTKKPKARKR